MTNVLEHSRVDITAAITRGASHYIQNMGYATLREFILPNGRRADLAGIDRKGRVVIAEVKSCKSDFVVDTKWESYEEYCDEFFFVVDEDFPIELFPAGYGILIADGFTAAERAPSRITPPLSPSRRKALTLRFGRQAAHRLASFL